MSQPKSLNGLDDTAAKPIQKLSRQYLEKMAVHMEQGIRDLPVWKDLVARVGLKEARQRLRQGMLTNWITDGNPEN